MRPLAALVLAESVVLATLAAVLLTRPSRAEPPTGTPSVDAVVASAGPAAATGGVGVPAHAVSLPDDGRRLAAPTPAFDAKDAIGIVLSGSVRGPDGAPVQGNVGARRADVYRSGTGAAPGSYAIAGLQPGEWTLFCRADGFAQHEQTVTLDDRAFQRIDLELRRNWVVRVKVLGADGKSVVPELERKSMWGLPSVVATAAPLTGDLPPTMHSGVTLFGLGEWKSYGGLSGKPQPELREQGYCGELRLHREPPAFASLVLRTTLLQSQRIEAGQQELVFTIEAADVLARHCTITLRLVDGATGQAIAGASVSVRTAQGGGSGAKTDADGRAVIEHVLPGIGMLEASMSGEREALWRFVRVPAGGTVDLGDIALTARTKITGVVVDTDGKPVNGASVQWTDLDSRTFPQPLVENRSASANAEGRFVIPSCGRHRYVVFARVFGGDPRFGVATVDATTGAPAPVTITLARPTAVSLKVGFDTTVGRTVTAVGRDGSPVAVATLGAEYRPQSMLLLPGPYTIEVHDLHTDRLVRGFPLQVGSEPLIVEVP